MDRDDGKRFSGIRSQFSSMVNGEQKDAIYFFNSDLIEIVNQFTSHQWEAQQAKITLIQRRMMYQCSLQYSIIAFRPT